MKHGQGPSELIDGEAKKRVVRVILSLGTRTMLSGVDSATFSTRTWGGSTMAQGTRMRHPTSSISFRDLSQYETNSYSHVSLASHELRSLQENGDLCMCLPRLAYTSLPPLACQTRHQARDDPVPF
jgi:hypothetical protein